MTDLSLPPSAHGLHSAREWVDAMAVPAWLHRQGELLHGNAALQRLCGRSQTVLCQLPYTELVSDTDRDTLQQATQACLQGGGEPPAQFAQLLAADGSIRHVELSLRRIVVDDEPTALVSCIDHSDIQHVQNSLQAMSGLLRQIVNGAPLASFVIDKFHRVTHWNLACERLTGRPAWKAIGATDPWRCFYDEERPLLADLIVNGADEASLLDQYQGKARKIATMAGAYECEGFFPHLGDAGCWLYFTAAPLLDDEGEVIGAIETLQDVSERHRSEEELTRHRNQLEQLVAERSAELASTARELEAFIDNAPIGVLLTVKGKVLRCNRELARKFGMDPAAVVGMEGRAFYLSDEDYSHLAQIAGPALQQGQPLQHDMWMRHSSGRPIWVQLNAYVANPHNTAAGTWWMVQDRTKIRTAEEELRTRFDELQDTNNKLAEAQNQLLQSDKMASIGQLAAGVAHEINNPVGFVSSNLNTLRQYVDELMGLLDAFAASADAGADPQAAAAAQAALAKARQAVELDYLKEDLPQLLDESADGLTRVKKIVQDLKDFSRVDQADWQEADLNAGLESTLNVVRHEVKYKAEVVMALRPLPAVLCLAAQLNQVFMNLIVNASHAIVERGTLTLSSGTQDDWVWVQVDDTGCGMSDEVRRRIFEPFYTTKDVGKGTGLGLSLSFSIVQKHGGAIQVRSTPGVGSKFRVWVPIAGPGAPGTPASVPPDWD
jgi:two-component system, NtrC family, sensor kinase